MTPRRDNRECEKRARNKTAGFSIIEVLVAFVILSMVVTYVEVLLEQMNTWKTNSKLNPTWESLTNAINNQIGL